MKVPNGWRKVRFGDVVHKVNDKVPNRDEWTFKRYIGGEHFDEGEIRITKSNPIEGNEEVIGSAFHMRFKPGQVLYVTRNPRLRKGGMVDFEGVCSNVSFVMEADETQLLQSLLPFVIQTEDFVMHTCNNAHGSTNPFLNWKDIAKYEFLLPPIEEQKKISEVLWGIENNLINANDLFKRLLFFKNKLLNELFHKGLNKSLFKKTKIGNIPSDWDVVPFGRITNKSVKYSFTGGPFGSDLKSEHYTKSGVRIIQLQNMGDEIFKNDYFLYTSKEKADQLIACNIYPGEIIMAKMAEPLARACYIPNYDERYVMCSDGIRIVVDERRYDKNFVFYSINSKYFRNNAIKHSTGTTRQRIGLGTLKNLEFISPPLTEQKQISQIISKFQLNIDNQEKYLNTLKDQRNKLSNELLSGKLRLER